MTDAIFADGVLLINVNYSCRPCCLTKQCYPEPELVLATSVAGRQLVAGIMQGAVKG